MQLRLFSKIKMSHFFFIFISFFLLCLSLFRYPLNDGAYYLLETSNLYDILKSRQWIGNEAVGLHGFLFKLPAALLFFITGPSVFMATLTTIALSMAGLVFFYRILGFFFVEERFRIFGVFMLSGSFFFLLSSVAFSREMPSLFSFLLLLFLLLKRGPYYLVGLALLLLLDAKEHVFISMRQD